MAKQDKWTIQSGLKRAKQVEHNKCSKLKFPY